MALSAAFNLPPKESLAYWRSRLPVTAAEYQQLSAAARERAFVVSSLARQEQIAAMHSSLLKALEKGQSIQSWRKELAALAEETSLSKARLNTIYRTNLQTAYQAGRYQAMLANAKERPYWRYLSIMDMRTRPSHAVLNGKVYPQESPFWDQFYPPNGFNCRCTVQSLTPQDVEERGYPVEEGLPGPSIYKDPLTGRESSILPAPDPGFGRNAGKDWLAGLSPRELEGELTPLPMRALCKDGKGLFASGNICKPDLATLDPRHILPLEPKDILPKGKTQAFYIAEFLKEFGLAWGQSKVIRLPGVGSPVAIDENLYLGADNKYKITKQGREPYVKAMARTIQNPYEIWFGAAKQGKNTLTRLSLIRLFGTIENKIGGFAAFRLAGKKWEGMTVFTPRVGKENLEEMLAYLERERTGVLLYREP